jgi:carbon monoxide dehydrogenase subunit G
LVWPWFDVPKYLPTDQYNVLVFSKGNLMLHFEGNQDFSEPLAEVRDKLLDARFLADCIPDRQSVAQSSPEAVVCTIRPGFAFVRGTLEVTLKVVESSESSGRLSLHSRGIGSSSDVEATLSFSPRDSGTRVHWQADVTSLGGLLKAVPKGLLQAAAQKVIADVWTAVAARFAK